MARFSLTLLSVITALLMLGGAAQAQTISIVSGNGQVTCPLCPVGPSGTFDNLVVLVKDGAGNPLPNYPVVFTVSYFAGATSSPTVNFQYPTTTVNTGSDGTASVSFQQPAPIGTTFGSSYSQSMITASTGVTSVTFYETTSVYDTSTSTSGISSPQIEPVIGTIISGQAGQVSSTAIRVRVPTNFGTGVPNVEVRLLPVDAAQTVTASCQTGAGASAGAVMTDSSGVATCYPVFGARIGTGQFTVQIGNKFVNPGFGPYNIEVSAGLPCALRIMNNSDRQNGTPGTQLPAPLIGQVEDCGGNVLSGVPVTWSVTQGTGTLTNQRNSTDGAGRVSANLTPGGAGGPLQVTLAVAPGTATANNIPVSVAFNFNISINISGLQKLTGDNQTAAINQTFAQPLQVQVNGPSGPLSGITVQFAASGSVTLSSASATTNAQGRASVTATAGPTAGSATVTATAGMTSVTFSLTVQPPGPQNVTFSNAAGGQLNFISPCSLAVMRGTGLATGIQGTVVPQLGFGPWLTQVSNVSIQFGNFTAPIYSVSNQGGQESVVFQVPCEVGVGSVPVTVRVGSGSGQFTAQVSAVAPGVFETTLSNGRRAAVLLKPDGTFATLENPARRGERIRAWVTGIGQTNPAVPTNSPGIPGQAAVIDPANLIVGVNNAGVQVISAGYVEGLIGVSEVVFQVPADTPAGLLPFAVAVGQSGGMMFGNGSTIPVQ